MDLAQAEPLPTLSTSNLNAKGGIVLTPIIETLWPDGALGFLGGPPKAGESTYAVEEALCLAMGWNVLGQYKVPERQRVLFVEEEDEIAKVNERVRALIRQRDLDPDKASVADELADSIQFVVQPRIVLNDLGSIVRLGATILQCSAQVVYLDALWRMTTLDLERPHNVRETLQGITQISQELGVRFRVVHHTVKRVGPRTTGRELHGSQMLRGWGLSSLMFGEPVNGLTTISYDGKDGSMVPLCQMKILASQPAPGQRSLFAGLEYAPLEGERARRSK